MKNNRGYFCKKNNHIFSDKVIFIAQNKKVLDDYFALKKLKQQAIDEGRLEEVEIEIAWTFGKLLSYSDEYISQLISEHTNWAPNDKIWQISWAAPAN